ncbi:PPC domain-containing DNA-binding protein [Pseudomonas sp. 5P_3.1_Bac2]|uniref:PPC domain-containing DNA-binding protein n=1 Tax=Pseudomonas sp. 5P_3.1_Bac2 TaxID=2971617 RepID=UPI0021C9F2AD|nr:PPC domain-containing DNA-binding protein [Pseudomonas sp. 5P_3.1_Bac2]MCU1715894.1 DNA-binding protein [Pseudomonas sp. 5P_3.1_Bac2]
MKTQAMLMSLTLLAASAAASAADYIKPSDVKPYGEAPAIQEKLVSSSATEKTYALILRTGDDVYTALNDFAVRHKVVAGRFTAIGAVRDVKVGWLDRKRKEYKIIAADQQVEILALTGDVGVVNGTPAVHAHVVLSRDDGSVWGGHLMHAVTSPTVEVIFTTYSTPLPKMFDDESGMTLFNFQNR